MLQVYSFIYILLFTWLLQKVFGLGNKTYEHYNKVAIYVDKRLEELGGKRVFELGLGDDDAKWENIINEYFPIIILMQHLISVLKMILLHGRTNSGQVYAISSELKVQAKMLWCASIDY